VITADSYLILLAGPQAREWRRMQPRVQSKPLPARYHALLALLCILPSGDPIVLQSEFSNMEGCLLNERLWLTLSFDALASSLPSSEGTAQRTHSE
jgi:hypothetical protein